MAGGMLTCRAHVSGTYQTKCSGANAGRTSVQLRLHCPARCGPNQQSRHNLATRTQQ
jgi:hypothetical protein